MLEYINVERDSMCVGKEGVVKIYTISLIKQLNSQDYHSKVSKSV